MSRQSAMLRRGIGALALAALGSIVLAACVKPAPPPPPPPPPDGHLTASPTSIDFGSVPAGTGANQDVTITNDGAAGIVVPVWTDSGPVPGSMNVANKTCFGGLAPGASCVISVGIPIIGGPGPGQYSITLTVNKPPGTLNPQDPITITATVTVT